MGLQITLEAGIVENIPISYLGVIVCPSIAIILQSDICEMGLELVIHERRICMVARFTLPRNIPFAAA